MTTNDFCFLVSANLNKQSICNADIALYADYLLKQVKLDNDDNLIGLNPFMMSFKYNFKFENDATSSSSSTNSSRHSSREPSPSAPPPASVGWTAPPGNRSFDHNIQ